MRYMIFITALLVWPCDSDGGECCSLFFSGETDEEGRLLTRVGVEGEENRVIGRVEGEAGIFPEDEQRVDVIFEASEPDDHHIWEVQLISPTL